MEKVIVNASDITHIKPLSKNCMLQSCDLAKAFDGVDRIITIKIKRKEFKVWLDSGLNYRYSLTYEQDTF
jgi:hypothetical protein